METHPHRKIIALGVTGSIAAHRAIDLTSEFTKLGYQVHVIMTEEARKFVTPLAFKTLSRNPVITSLHDEEEGWKPAHIELADKADAILIAPCSAQTIARLAWGFADDPLSAVALALEPHITRIIAPAMNGKMWLNSLTQDNVRRLKDHGWQFIGPASGMLSCGYEGIGRLWETQGIVETTHRWLNNE